VRIYPIFLAHRTLPYLTIQKGIRIYPSIVSIPYPTVSAIFPVLQCSRSAVFMLFFRISANRIVPKHEPFFVILTLENLNLLEFIRKSRIIPRCFFIRKRNKTDIYGVRSALITVFSFEKRNFALKNEIIIITLRYKNAQIFTSVLFAVRRNSHSLLYTKNIELDFYVHF
jgi:hypothetical protein